MCNLLKAVRLFLDIYNYYQHKNVAFSSQSGVRGWQSFWPTLVVQFGWEKWQETLESRKPSLWGPAMHEKGNV